MRTWSRSLRFGRWLVLMVAPGVILGPVEAAFALDRQTQVLVLYSARRDAQMSIVGDRELPRLLEQGLGGGLDYYSEYIDLARFPDSGYQVAFRDFLRLKYKGQRFDAVIAIQDTAVEFIGKNRDELFPGTPVVFLASRSAPRRLENSTGVIAELNLSGTLALAAALQPDARHVFVVSGAARPDQVYESLARRQLRSFEGRFTITYLSGLAAKDLEARLATLPEHSIVYFLLVYQDGAGGEFPSIGLPGPGRRSCQCPDVLLGRLLDRS